MHHQAHLDYQTVAMAPRKRIALVAHDGKKEELLAWARYNRDLLAQHDLHATGTTGQRLAEELGLTVTRHKSGPLGGDQQIGARIAEGAIDLLIFFWDPLAPHPHDADVKALLRIAVVWNVPVACNWSSADFLISSPLVTGAYERLYPAYERRGNGAGVEAGDDAASDLSGGRGAAEVIAE